jgi:hypothetical protein
MNVAQRELAIHEPCDRARVSGASRRKVRRCAPPSSAISKPVAWRIPRSSSGTERIGVVGLVDDPDLAEQVAVEPPKPVPTSAR